MPPKSDQEKCRLIAETLLPGETVHAVAQRRGVNTSQLFSCSRGASGSGSLAASLRQWWGRRCGLSAAEYAAAGSGTAGPRRFVPNRTVRSLFPPPERGSFKPTPLRASSNLLIFQASNIRTKTGVVRLRQRKGAGRDGKRPILGPSADARGSGRGRRRPAFCAVPTVRRAPKRMSRTGRLADRRGLEQLVRCDGLSVCRTHQPATASAGERASSADAKPSHASSRSCFSPSSRGAAIDLISPQSHSAAVRPRAQAASRDNRPSPA
jgi:hypothetical protein